MVHPPTPRAEATKSAAPTRGPELFLPARALSPTRCACFGALTILHVSFQRKAESPHGFLGCAPGPVAAWDRRGRAVAAGVQKFLRCTSVLFQLFPLWLNTKQVPRRLGNFLLRTECSGWSQSWPQTSRVCLLGAGAESQTGCLSRGGRRLWWEGPLSHLNHPTSRSP